MRKATPVSKVRWPLAGTALLAIILGQIVLQAGAQTLPANGAGRQPATSPTTQPGPAGVYGELMNLLRNKMPEEVLEQRIRREPSSLDLTSDQLIELKKAGASDNLIRLLVTHAGTASAQPAKAAELAPVSLPPDPTSPAANKVESPDITAPVTAPLPACAASGNGPSKKVTAIQDFDYSAVKTAVQAIFQTDQNIGQGIRALLTKRLAEEGKVTVVERAKLETVMKEQDLTQSSRVRQGTGSRTGRIRGADVILMGDIVAFGRDDRKISAGGLLGIWGKAAGAVVGAFGKHKAVVVLNFRLVDAESSEVVAQGEARGESARQSSSWGGLIAGATGIGGGLIDFTSSNFAQTILGEATIDSVNKLTAQFNEQVPKLPDRKIQIEGRIAALQADSVTLNVGSADGVKMCDKFELSKILEEIRDPISKELLDLKSQPYGQMVVLQVRDRVAVGAYTGSKVPQAGDMAVKQQ